MTLYPKALRSKSTEVLCFLKNLGKIAQSRVLQRSWHDGREHLPTPLGFWHASLRKLAEQNGSLAVQAMNY